jgi:hypothetical protein
VIEWRQADESGQCVVSSRVTMSRSRRFLTSINRPSDGSCDKHQAPRFVKQEPVMKKIFLAVTAAAILASPVLAQTDQKSGPAEPRAQAPATTTQPTGPAVKGPNDVYCGNIYVGSDPDPKVRLEMLRNFRGECQGQ